MARHRVKSTFYEVTAKRQAWASEKYAEIRKNEPLLSHREVVALIWEATQSFSPPFTYINHDGNMIVLDPLTRQSIEHYVREFRRDLENISGKRSRCPNGTPKSMAFKKQKSFIFRRASELKALHPSMFNREISEAIHKEMHSNPFFYVAKNGAVQYLTIPSRSLIHSLMLFDTKLPRQTPRRRSPPPCARTQQRQRRNDAIAQEAHQPLTHNPKETT